MQRSGHNKLQRSHDSHSLKPRQRWACSVASPLLRPNSTGANPFFRFFIERVFVLLLRKIFCSHCFIIWISHFSHRIGFYRNSTLRLPGLKARACSGLTLSGASLPRLQRRGLALPNGSNFSASLLKKGTDELSSLLSSRPRLHRSPSPVL